MDLGWFEVSLDVKDVTRTCDFYEKLGFEVVYRAERVITPQKADCPIYGGGTAALLRDPDGRTIYFINMLGVSKDAQQVPRS